MIAPLIAFGQNQVFFSENWNQDGGEVPLFYKNASATDDIGNVYMAGSTINTNNNHDIIIQKFDADGGLLWQQTFNGAANMDDMAADIFVDANNDVYVTGTSVEYVNHDDDLVVLKYNSNGQFLWASYYDNGGSPTPKDYGTAVTGDNSGNIFVTGSSFAANDQMDYVTLRINSSDGAHLWVERYDHVSLNDVAAKIEVHGNFLYISGGSQISFNKWELATVVYNTSNGNLIAEKRSQGNATHGVNEVYDLTVDNAGNVYVTGAVVNQNTGYDISIYKLDPQLNILWEAQYDGYGADDRGKGIKVDNQGNVYVAGFVSNPNEGKNYSLLKFNSSGALQWSREFNGEANLDDEAAQLVIRSNQDVFVTGSAINNVDEGIVTLGYKPNGEIFTQAKFGGENGLVAKPTGIANDIAGNIIVIGKMEAPSGNSINITVKYNLIEKPFNPVMVNGEPSHNANEILIRFDRSAVKYLAIDRKGFIAGKLSDFVRPDVIGLMNEKLKMEVSRLNTFKIFRRMTTADSLSVTRLGDTISVDDFWATLSVVFPNSFNILDGIDSLNTLPKTSINYAHENVLIDKHNSSLDEFYVNDFQSSIKNTSTYPNAHINLEPAWSIEVGQEFVKVGVYDDPIHFKHEEFGDGTLGGSKIKGGYNYYTNTPLDHYQSLNADNHGTAGAGIIGALRNNFSDPTLPESIGISGIAGGDNENQNSGVKLYSGGIFYNKYLSTISLAAEAIVEGSIESTDPNTKMGFGLHLQNHSWGYDDLVFNEIVILKDAVKTAWRNHSVFVASRGNKGKEGSPIEYPACFEDEMVINVGASGVNGTYKSVNNGDEWTDLNKRWSSSTGGNLDLIAPGVTDLVKTTVYIDVPNIKPLDYPNGCIVSNGTWGIDPKSKYQCFNGTSASAPHVTGVAALMYSRHNLLSINPPPNNLTTEDIENIIEKTASGNSVSPNGEIIYSDYTGNGLIDAGQAVKQINYPKYYVKHSDFSFQPSVTILQSDLNVQLTATINGMTPGSYVADLYEYEWNYQNNVLSSVGEEIIDWWPVLAGTYKGVSSSTTISGSPDMDITPSVNLGGTVSSVNIVTYAWFVTYNNSLNQPENKWIAGEAINNNPDNLKFMYSIHVKNSSLVSIEDEELQSEIILYPNPTNESLTVSFNNEFYNPEAEIFNLKGQLIKKTIGSSNNESLTIDVSKLSKGIYILRLHDNESSITKKFIKN
jgi:hypothetical protein